MSSWSNGLARPCLVSNRVTASSASDSDQGHYRSLTSPWLSQYIVWLPSISLGEGPPKGSRSVAALRIVKRTGEVVVFDRARIRNAVVKAVRAVGSAEVEPGRLDALVDRVSRGDRRRASPTSSPTSRTSRTSSRSTSCATASTRSRKAYILYRADRQRERDAAQGAAPSSARARPAHRADARRAHRPLQPQEVRGHRRRALAADLGSDVSVRPRRCKEVLNNVHDGIPTPTDRAGAGARRRRVHRARSGLQLPRRAPAARSAVQGGDRPAATAPAGRHRSRRDAAYRMSFVNAIRRGVDARHLRRALRAFDLARSPPRSSPSATGCFQYLGIQTLADRYLGAPTTARRDAAGLLDARRDGPRDQRGGPQRRARSSSTT